VDAACVKHHAERLASTERTFIVANKQPTFHRMPMSDADRSCSPTSVRHLDDRLRSDGFNFIASPKGRGDVQVSIVRFSTLCYVSLR
jgi:hypothetical protein